MSGIPLNIDWQQILLHLFNFVILFAILYFLLYKPVKNFMAKREEYYKAIDKQAQAKLDEAELIKVNYNNKLTEAEEEIRLRKEKVRLDLEKATAKKLRDAEEEAVRIMDKAKRDAQLECQKIINGAQTEISAMVATATEKLALEATASEAFDQFLEATERGSEDE